MAYFQCGFVERSGEAKVGLVRIYEVPGKRRMKVTWIGDTSDRSRLLGSFTLKEWRDQEGVNQTLRGRGLLWRRMKDEGEYAMEKLKPLPSL